MQVSSWCLLLICFVIFTSPSRVLASLTLTLDKCQHRPRLSARPALLASRVSASLRYRGSEIINTLEMTVLLMSGMLGSGLWCVVTDKWTSMLQFYPKRFIMWLSFIHSLRWQQMSCEVASGAPQAHDPVMSWRPASPPVSGVCWLPEVVCVLYWIFSCIFSHFGHVFSCCCTVIKSLADGNVLTVVLHKDLRCCSFLTDWILAITGKS